MKEVTARIVYDPISQQWKGRLTHPLMASKAHFISRSFSEKQLKNQLTKAAGVKKLIILRWVHEK